MRARIAACLLWLSALGCERCGPTAGPPLSGWFRFVLTGEASPEIPFFVSLPAEAQGRAAIINGKQWFSIDHAWDGDRLVIDFPLYSTQLVLDATTLQGRFESHSPTWGEASLVLSARRVAGPEPLLRFPAPAPEVALAALTPAPSWRVELPDSGTAKLLLEQDDRGGLGATIQFANGNSVYLAGAIHQRRLMASGFDGTSPYYFDAELDPSDAGKMKGRWISGQDLGWRESFSATAEPNVELPPILVFDDRPIRFPALDAPPYAGKPVLLLMVASWCAHCRAAAPLLRELWDKHHAAGLEVLALGFEMTEDRAFNEAQAKAMREAYHLPFFIEPQHGLAEVFWSKLPESLRGKQLPELPVFIVVSAERRPIGVRVGFVGPESGVEHQNQKADLERWIESALRGDR
jgi:thiol-disulfide isomerase/thioredoxin